MPNFPVVIISIAFIPNLVPSTLSKAVGVPPRPDGVGAGGGEVDPVVHPGTAGDGLRGIEAVVVGQGQAGQAIGLVVGVGELLVGVARGVAVRNTENTAMY